MAMTEEEVLREAGRIRANRRTRHTKSCARCGKSFEGVSNARFCSDACRVAASRARADHRTPDPDHVYVIEGLLPGESAQDYLVRMRQQLVESGELLPEEAELTSEDKAWLERSELMNQMRDETFRRVGTVSDTVELIRQMREEQFEKSGV